MPPNNPAAYGPPVPTSIPTPQQRPGVPPMPQIPRDLIWDDRGMRREPPVPSFNFQIPPSIGSPSAPGTPPRGGDITNPFTQTKLDIFKAILMDPTASPEERKGALRELNRMERQFNSGSTGGGQEEGGWRQREKEANERRRDEAMARNETRKKIRMERTGRKQARPAMPDTSYSPDPNNIRDDSLRRQALDLIAQQQGLPTSMSPPM